MTLSKIGVLGAGIMGSGIGLVAAMSGFQVVVRDINKKILDKAKQRVTENLAKSIEKGKLTPEGSEKVLSNLTWTVNFDEAVSGRDIVIEAVPENLELKKEIFQILDECSNPRAILASNTSSFSISSLASATKNQGRVVGMHWFNPPVMMKLIEVIKGITTSSETVEIVCELAEACGKETVVCADSPGFIVTRALVALRLECYRIYSEGIASKEDIDKALKLGLAHPMGQFELADLSGLDIEPPIYEALEKAYGERFKAPQNLLNRVMAGWFGRKSGRGWYDYSKS